MVETAGPGHHGEREDGRWACHSQHGGEAEGGGRQRGEPRWFGREER